MSAGKARALGKVVQSPQGLQVGQCPALPNDRDPIRHLEIEPTNRLDVVDMPGAIVKPCHVGRETRLKMVHQLGFGIAEQVKGWLLKAFRGFDRSSQRVLHGAVKLIAGKRAPHLLPFRTARQANRRDPALHIKDTFAKHALAMGGLTFIDPLFPKLAQIINPVAFGTANLVLPAAAPGENLPAHFTNGIRPLMALVSAFRHDRGATCWRAIQVLTAVLAEWSAAPRAGAVDRRKCVALSGLAREPDDLGTSLAAKFAGATFPKKGGLASLTI